MAMRTSSCNAISRPLSAFLMATAFATACTQDKEILSPTLEASQVGAPVSCNAGCLLVDHPGPFRVAALWGDSANIPINIATMTIAGGPGDSVMLALSADSVFLGAKLGSLRIVSTTRNQRMASTIEDLRNGAVVHRFAARETVTLQLEMPRTGEEAPDGKVSLVLSTGGRVTDAVRPWMSSSESSISVLGQKTTTAATGGSGSTVCVLDQATGECGWVVYEINPFSPGHAFGTFQSSPGTGVMTDINITFSAPIQSITVTIQDPTFEGNTMTAFDGAGNVVGSVAFAFNNLPGTNETDEQTIVGPIERVLLVPAPGDYVAYDATIDVGTGEQALNVICVPATPVRGDPVACTASLALPQAFAVVERKARRDGPNLTDQTHISVAAGDEYVWNGTAVVSTKVIFKVELVENGRTRTLRQGTEFDVQPRSWPVWQPQLRIEAFVITGKMVEYPRRKTTLGHFVVLKPDARPVLGRASTGPNTGIAFVYEPYQVLEFDVALHPGLRPHPGIYPGSPEWRDAYEWYDDQNGTGGGTCVSGDLPAVIQWIRRHEGATLAQNSHYGVAIREFARLRPDRIIERLYSTDVDDVFSETVVDEMKDFVNSGAYRRAQERYDRNDSYLDLESAVNCSLDFDRNTRTRDR